MNSLGQQRLLAKLKALDISEREAAARIGVARSTMHRILSGERAPQAAVIFRIEKAFGVEGASFFVAPRKSKSAAA